MGARLPCCDVGNASRILDGLRSGTSQLPQGQHGVLLVNHAQSRVMTRPGGNPPDAKPAAWLYSELPGLAFLCHGEEPGRIGDGPSPMQCTGGPSAGLADATR